MQFTFDQKERPLPESVVRGNPKIFAVLTILFALCASFKVSAQDALTGFWQHTDKPAVIEFDLSTGLATIYQHKDHRDADGLTIIQDIIAAEQGAEHWMGHMYNGYIDTWVPVFLYLESSDTLVVSDDEGNTVLTLMRLSDGQAIHSNDALRT